MHLKAAVLAAALASLSALVPAHAGLSDDKSDSSVTTYQDGDRNTTVFVNSDGSVDQPSSGGGGSGLRCSYFDTFNTESDAIQFSPNPGTFEDGSFYWVECVDQSGAFVLGRYFQYSPAVPPVSPYRLALAAASTLHPPYPEPRTSPDMAFDQLVGIDTWLWVDPATWEPLSTSVSIPGIGATVTATPMRMEWDMGDGQPVVICEGPGTPYDTGRPEASQSTDCSHLYQFRGAYTATATVVYEVTWSATNGDGGTLEPARRSTQFPMSVAERQAVGA